MLEKTMLHDTLVLHLCRSRFGRLHLLHLLGGLSRLSRLLLSVRSVLLEVLAVAQHRRVDGDDEHLDEDRGHEVTQNDNNYGGSDR